MTLHNSQTPHFGNSSTSRVEGAHHRLKNFLDGSNNDFFTCFKAFHRAAHAQFTDIMVSTGIESQKTLLGTPECFRELNGVISHYALKKIKTQYDLIPQSNKVNCTKTFRGAWGMPCSHKLAQALEHGDCFSPELFHQQWFLTMVERPPNYEDLKKAVIAKVDRLLELPEHALRRIYEDIVRIETGRYALTPIANAIVKQDTRGRPRNNKRRAGSQRNDSRWKSNMELQEEEDAIKEGKKSRNIRGSASASSCGNGSQAGHNQKTCPARSLGQPQGEAVTTIAIHQDQSDGLSSQPVIDLGEGHKDVTQTVQLLDKTSEGTGSSQISQAMLHPDFQVSPAPPSSQSAHPSNQPHSCSSGDVATPSTSRPRRMYRCSICKLPTHRANKCPTKVLQRHQPKTHLHTIQDDEKVKDSNPLSNVIHPQTQEQDVFTEVSDDSYQAFWPDSKDDDSNLCLFCDEKMPPEPSQKLLKLQARLLALPNITKRLGHKKALSLPVSSFLPHIPDSTLTDRLADIYTHDFSSAKPRIFAISIRYLWEYGTDGPQ